MKKALIVYCKENYAAKTSKEEKTAQEFEKLFKEKGFFVKRTLIEPKTKLDKKKIKKNENLIEFKSNPPSVNEFDFVVIGTPIIASLKSSPIINAYIKSLPKNKTNSKQKYVLYATGIIPGFAIKKMQSLLSMSGIKTLDTENFT
ncbi:MAG: hypothetical protein WCI04_01985, partial [archaeon]